MDTTLYVGLSHQTALQRRLDLVANNIANMNTTGFQREDELFSDYLMKLDGAGGHRKRNVAFVLDQGVARDFSGGTLQQTDNPLDVAILGDGFFAVRNDLGQTRYTRNGQFTLNADRQLSMPTGELVLDTNGNPITFQPNDTGITITSEGQVSASSGPVAEIRVVDFANKAKLEKAGDTLYLTDEAEQPATDARLQQGTIELSNVNPVEEITDMLKVLRSYQASLRMIDDYEQLRGRAIRQLGQVR